MTTLHDCSLNGTLLSSLDERLCVLDVTESPPEMRRTTHALWGGGEALLLDERAALEIRVCFCIHEEEPVRRAEVLQSVRAWAARGGLLATADRPGLQLQVICAALPGLSADSWTEALTLAFRSARAPYWEAATATRITTADAALLTVPGTADATPVEAAVINTGSADITTLTLQCADTRLVFDGLTLPPGELFMLTLSEGTLVAWVNGESVLKYRTAESDDLLLVPCGEECTVYATSDGSLSATFSARGRYL